MALNQYIFRKAVLQFIAYSKLEGVLRYVSKFDKSKNGGNAVWAIQ